MNIRATLLVLTMVLAGCSASHDDRSTLATPQPTAATTAVSAPIAGLATTQGGASKAARAAAVESRSSNIPKIRDVPAGGVASSASASPAAVVTPQSGASEAARAAAVESRSSTIPKIRDVPAGGVMSAPRAGGLPAGVPYASDKDPVQIISYVLSSTIIHPGDKVTGDVVTSSNAASVTAQVGSITIAVPKVAPGKFHLLMQLPSMPLPPGAEKLIITAIRTDGMRTTREVPITVVL